MVSAVCSDEVPVMLGRKSGFSAAVKADAPHIIVTHCILHRHALEIKTLPPKLAEVLQIVAECVRHRIFSELSKEMGSEFEVLLYHSNIRWLFRGQVLNRVFDVCVELSLFLQEHRHCHADCFKNSEFILILAYLGDIFTEPGSTATLQNNNAFNVLVSTNGNVPAIAEKALEIFIPFVTTYLCEQSFSRMVGIKSKKRNRLCCENDMKVALAKVKPRISVPVSQRQQQKSH
ncbi:hypothetical protein FHG87_017991 [Trinorchestia longiramus]|nr:hypothetical protein FHG87_017991 [Trinorchestia longiramus]